MWSRGPSALHVLYVSLVGHNQFSSLISANELMNDSNVQISESYKICSVVDPEDLSWEPLL